MDPTFARAMSAPAQANVLVAFADCSRFMQSTKGRSSAELFADLNDFYTLIDDAVQAAGGLVVKFMGDAALVVFPEDLADRGIMALLDLKANVDRWLEGRPIAHGLHVNVHFGEVTLGRMGRSGNLDVIGETVHIAATLGARSFALSQQAFRQLTPEHRQLFHKFTPPVLYLPEVLSRETHIVAFATVVAFAAYVWASQYWIDLVDEGYFVYLATRVQQGDLPYRDFDTYYTPAVFYLYAATFDLFGVGVMPIRILMAAVRTACGVLLYRLTRRVAPWPFAVLPFLAVVAMDPVPIHPEPHPAWWALLATLFGLEAIVAHTATRRLRWIALAGAAAAVAFAFKQNVGAFTALAVGGYLLLRPRNRLGRLVVVSRAVYVAFLALVATVLLWPALDDLVVVAIWLPLLATLALLLRQSWYHARPAGWLTGLGSVVSECMLAGAAFVGVTLLWLGPLVFALGPEQTPFGLFVGVSVNQGALILPLAPPPRAVREVALFAIWIPLGLAMLFGERSRRRAGRLVAVGLGASVLVPLIPTLSGPSEPLAEDPDFYPWLEILNTAFSTLFLYVPALGAWAGLVTVGATIGREALVGIVPWYLLVGTLAALAIYPRADFLHVVFAGPPLFVVGAWALSRAHSVLAGQASRLGQAAIFAALLVIPAAAVTPHVYWRYVALVHADPRSPTPPPYVPLGLERAPVLVPRHIADSVRGAVELVRAGTPPGDPFFAYPAATLFNFLADRPNPSRFSHFMPGALTAEQLAEVIASLEAARPRYVLWDHSQVVSLGTEPANHPLSEYVWRCYEPVTSLSPFVILERRSC